jgi:hypothetical protein
MKLLRKPILLVFVLLLTGCASRFTRIEQPNTPFERPGYTVHSPKQDGWVYAKYENPGEHVILFGKPLKEVDHTLYASVKEIPSFAKFEKPEDFLDFQKKASKIGNDPRRFNYLDEQLTLEHTFGDFTVAYYVKAEDHGAVQRSGAPFLVMETCAYYFIHPTIPNLMVNIIYSERAKNGELPDNFKRTALEFVNGIKLKNK